jgi:hypothetical protein
MHMERVDGGVNAIGLEKYIQIPRTCDVDVD